MKNLTEIFKGEGAICDPASVCDIFNGQKMSKKNYPLSNSHSTYWIETGTDKGGLSSIIQYNFKSAQSINLSGTEFNVKSKIHEYGGVPYHVDEMRIFFVNSDDQNIYQIKNKKITKITNLQNVRIGEIASYKNHLYFIVEDGSCGSSKYPINYIAYLNLEDANNIKKLIAGASFYSNLKISSDGLKLLWLEWDLPFMPWEASKLISAALSAQGVVGELQKIDGGLGRSIFQPEWDGDDIIYVREDFDSGKLFRYDNKGEDLITDLPVDLMKPLWVTGLSSYKIINDQLIFASGWREGRMKQIVINRIDNKFHEYDFNFISDQFCVKDNFVIFSGSTENSSDEIFYLDTVILPPKKINVCREVYQTESVNGCYINHFKPHSRKENGSAIIKIHSGPTSCSNYTYSSEREYWRDRGFGFIEIDYRGSTNYGINYRKTLDGNWGIYDTQDVIDVRNYLSGMGFYDPKKIILKGSSAGGFTLLNSLCEDIDIGCASCYYGVSDLGSLLKDTHKFESGYTNSLIGVNENKSNLDNLLQSRSPILKIEKIKTPIIFFQGMNDPVVQPDQTKKIYDQLILNGIDAKMYLFENEGHGFRMKNTIDKCRFAEEQFFSKCLDMNDA